MQVHALPGFHEPIGSLTHLLGALVFAALAVPLLRRAWGQPLRVFLLAVYAFTCVFLLAMSGVYHMLPDGGAARAVLARLDMAGIFVLIAGTHTPVQGIYFSGLARWGVLGLMWSLVATGITLLAVYFEQLPRGLETTIFLSLGWIASLAGIVVWKRYGTAQVRLLILGGVVYSLGALLLGMRWPNLWPGYFGPHELWHVAVLVAMGLHWRFLFESARRPLST